MDQVLQILPIFLLVLCRITAFFVTAPVFSTRGVPLPFKIGMSVFVSLITFMAMPIETMPPIDTAYVLLVVKEVLIGLLYGFTAYLFFSVVQIAGSFVDTQMGLGIANVMDPMTGAQSPITGNFKFFIAILLFLALNGHHYLLKGIMDSYTYLPIVSDSLFRTIANGNLSTFLVQAFVSAFYLAFQLVAPMIVSLFLVDVALGMLARTSPQFNIFVIGLPVKLMVGLFLLFIMVPGFAFLFQDLFATMFKHLDEMMLMFQDGAQ